MSDLFETPELLPLEVQAILDKYCDMDNTYENCGNLVDELEQVGYTCEYGLDATPYDLRCMKTQMRNDIEISLIRVYFGIGMDKPSNHEDILAFVFEDICDSADKFKWNNSDIIIGFRRWIESNIK